MNAPLKLGQSIARREDRRFLTGTGRYTDDTVPDGALAVLFVRSPHAHARIAGIDREAALASPGVAAIYTAEDTAADRLGHLPAISEIKDAAGNRHREPPHLPMPVGKVRHVGDIVAMIVAGTLDQARDAADLLVVDYEELPAVVTVAQALTPGAALVHDDVPGNLMCRWSKGDAAATDAAFAKAAHVSSLSIRSPRQIVHYMETRAAWSAYDAASDLVTVTFGSQGVQIPHRLMCERVLNVGKDRLRLVTEDVGGGFGPKYPIYAEPTLVAWATRKLGRGLRWTADRAELALADSHSRDLVATGELALDAAGKFLGVRVKAEANYGAYVSMFAPTIATTGMAKVISGLYRIPAIRLDFDCAFTNTVPVDAIRGAGKPEALFLLERLVDIGPRTCPTRRRAATPTTRPTASSFSRRPSIRPMWPASRHVGRQAKPPASAAASAFPVTCTAPAASPTSTLSCRSKPTVWWRASAHRARARATRRSSPSYCRRPWACRSSA
jgi:carbon-monoxide dehydrogenase large subunit